MKNLVWTGLVDNETGRSIRDVYKLSNSVLEIPGGYKFKAFRAPFKNEFFLDDQYKPVFSNGDWESPYIILEREKNASSQSTK